MNREPQLGAPLAPRMESFGVGSGSLPLVLSGGLAPASVPQRTPFSRVPGEIMFVKIGEAEHRFWIPESLRGELPNY